MKQMTKIACIGEVMIELVSQGDTQAILGVAGDTYNTAVYLAQLARGSDVTVSYITGLGTDKFSDRARAQMVHYGIDDSCVEVRADKSIGMYAIDTDDAGERSFTYWRSDSAARTLFSQPCQIGFDVLDGFDLVFLSAITLAVLPAAVRADLMVALDGFRARGGRVAFDSNHRPRLWPDQRTAQDVNTAMWARTDIGLPSVDDEIAIHNDVDEAAVLARLTACGLNDGALKRGSSGPHDLTGQHNDIAYPAATGIKDTTAAGDSFNAGYLHAIATGQSQQQAMMAGHLLASRVIQHAGAIIDL